LIIPLAKIDQFGTIGCYEAYSPEYVEGKFSEICIQRRAYNAASEPKGSILNAAALDDRLLHLVELDRYTGS